MTTKNVSTNRFVSKLQHAQRKEQETDEQDCSSKLIEIKCLNVLSMIIVEQELLGVAAAPSFLEHCLVSRFFGVKDLVCWCFVRHGMLQLLIRAVK